jgi:hypothetical protein
MGFTIDAAFPTIGHYRAQSDVMVSSITPSAPEGPTILVQISGDGSIGSSGAASTKDFDNGFTNSPYQSPYRLTIPLAHRRKRIMDDRENVMPYTEQFAAEDESGRYYTAVGRKRRRFIIFLGEAVFSSSEYAHPDYAARDSIDRNERITYEKDGKKITHNSNYRISQGSKNESLVIEDWVGVIDKVYADGLP